MSDFSVLLDKKQAALTRLIEAARAVNEGAVVAEGNCCGVALEDIQELEAALREWGQ